MSDLTFPTLPYAQWVETKETLHLFLQIIGKIRLKAHPKQNHWWHVTLYPAARGLTTGRIPYQGGGFQIDFDMLDHLVLISRNDGRVESFPAAGKTVAAFYKSVFEAMQRLGLDVSIKAVPYENKSTIPFAEDEEHKIYDRDAVTRFWRALCSIASVFERFRGEFAGKQTPVHLYWHSFDLVSTRFSGRAAPLENARTQSDREAYSHEVISVGFWPGDDTFPETAFYGYAYPEPEGLSQTSLSPDVAFWAEKNGGALAVLKYEDMRQATDPEAALLAFLHSVYEGAAAKAGWNTTDYAHAYADRT